MNTPEKNAKIKATIDEAILPYALATVAKRYLRQTPEYEVARRERRAKAWLESEGMSAGYLLAETLTQRLEDLDP